VDGDTKDKLKVDALLMEYREIRQESRTYEVLIVICIIISILSFVAMFIAAVSSHQLILLFISLVSLFFILLTMGILSYNTTLGLRASQIEDSLKDILNEPTIQWESSAGIFRTASEDILTTKVSRYWMMISVFIIASGLNSNWSLTDSIVV